MNDNSLVAKETLAIHAGNVKDEKLSVVTPIYQTSTFGFHNADHGARLFKGEEEGYIYSRMLNPTVQALENCVAALEGGTNGLACGSGMAAIHTSLAHFLSAGDHIICSDAVYGPTNTLIRDVLSRFDIQHTFIDSAVNENIKNAVQPNTKVIYVETPGNPTLCLTDLSQAAEIAHEHNAQLIVDNTFMSPILQNPFEWGADLVVHSMTKFLNGHADVVGGMIVTKDSETYQAMRKTLNQLGGVLPPMESFLVHRGIKTFARRMKQHCENAKQIATYLENHPKVDWVAYPGLPSFPQYELAKKQMRSPGGMISFGLKGGYHAGKALMNSVSLLVLAVSLGGVESLIQHPASMTHASMGPEQRKKANISDGLVRLSVGVENVEDIQRDLDQALANA